ncbi:MAG: hypothetical protein JOZ81_04335, partial [Chloroflexi bacterium]|nr:hypothetical protein [Chloroflexota bacterium]
MLAVLAFGLLVLSPALGAQFVLVDDHEIIALTPPIGTSIGPAINVGGMALESDPSVGRFRPLYWTVRLNEVIAFGANPRPWHATVVGLGLLASLLLFGAARTLGATVIEAGLLAAWLQVAPGVSSLWVRLGADDTLATVFLYLSIFACTRAARGSLLWDVVFVIAAAATFLTKEAFALTALALAGLRVFAGGRRLTWSAVVVFALGVAETLIVFLIGARAGPLSYGGRYLAVPALGEYARSLAQNAVILAFAGMGWLGLAAGVLRRRGPEGSQAAVRPRR